MAAFIVRLVHNRLRVVAQQRQISMNKLFEGMTTTHLTEFDVEARFWMRASQGSATGGLRLLNTLRGRYQEQEPIPDSGD